MENENINDLNEQDIIDLYDDIVESPMTVAALVRCSGNLVYYNGNCCTKGTYTDRYGLQGGFCQASY